MSFKIESWSHIIFEGSTIQVLDYEVDQIFCLVYTINPDNIVMVYRSHNINLILKGLLSVFLEKLLTLAKNLSCKYFPIELMLHKVNCCEVSPT